MTKKYATGFTDSVNLQSTDKFQIVRSGTDYCASISYLDGLYLPLGGGTITGSVTFSSGNTLTVNTINNINPTDTFTLPMGFTIQDVVGEGTMFGIAFVASGSLQGPIVETHDLSALKLNGNSATVDTSGNLVANTLKSATLKPATTGGTINIGDPSDGDNNYYKFLSSGIVQPAVGYSFTLGDASNASKQVVFDISGTTANFATYLKFNATGIRDITFPNATTTLVGDDTTNTLTNKTISGSSNTLSNIGNSSLTNSSVTLNGTAVSLGASGTIPVNTTSTTTNASYYPLFVSSSSNGNQSVNLGTGLTFNPSTNTLTTTTFSGALSGAATSVSNSLTVGTGLKLDSGTTFNGSAAKTISPSLPYVQLTKNATQSLTADTETSINWNTANYANTNLWTNANQSRLLCAYTGLYNVQSQLEFQPSTASRNFINIKKNGSSLGLNRDTFASNGIYTNNNIGLTLNATAGDYFEITAYSASANGTIDAGQDLVTFTYLGTPV